MTENQSKLTKFNPENSDLITQLIFDDRITKPMLMIYKYLSIPVKDKETKKVYKRTAYSARGISIMMGLTLNMTIRSLKSLRDLKFIELANNKYFIVSLDLNLDQTTESDLPVDQIRSTHRSESDLPVDHNITEVNITENISEYIPQNPISFDPVFKSEHQDVEASYVQNGNSVECSFKLKPKQELEQDTQTPRLPAIKSTETNLEALAPDRIPNLLPRCEYFKISDHNKGLVREWFKENGMTDDHIKLAVREVELWLKNAKKGSKAFKARKVTGQSDHHLYLYSAWAQENLAKRLKASASMQQVGKINVEAELYQEFVEAFGEKPTGTMLNFTERERLQEHRAFKSFLGNDNKDTE